MPLIAHTTVSSMYALRSESSLSSARYDRTHARMLMRERTRHCRNRSQVLSPHKELVRSRTLIPAQRSVDDLTKLRTFDEHINGAAFVGANCIGSCFNLRNSNSPGGREGGSELVMDSAGCRLER